MTLLRTSPANVYRREIHSDLAEANSLCAEIRELLAPTDMAEARFAVELLAHESLSNAVIHGNQKSADKRVSLELRLGRNWIRLRVTDEGRGFEWRKEGLSICDAAATSGRGIALYALYAGRVQFNACGNRVTLWISRKAKSGKQS